MKGLLRKEFYVNRLNLLWFGALIVLFFVLYVISPSQSPFFLYYPALLISTISTAAMAQDESDRWDVFSAALPCSRAQLVSVKYLSVLITALPFSLLALVVSLVRTTLWSFIPLCFTIIYLLLVSGANLFAGFKWGARKSRIPSTILTLGLFFLLSIGSLNDTSHTTFVIFLTLAAVVLFFLLWFLSIHAYQKRDL